MDNNPPNPREYRKFRGPTPALVSGSAVDRKCSVTRDSLCAGLTEVPTADIPSHVTKLFLSYNQITRIRAGQSLHHTSSGSNAWFSPEEAWTRGGPVGPRPRPSSRATKKQLSSKLCASDKNSLHVKFSSLELQMGPTSSLFWILQRHKSPSSGALTRMRGRSVFDLPINHPRRGRSTYSVKSPKVQGLV